MARITLAGIAGFFINGTAYQLGDDITYNPDMMVFEEVSGLTGYAGTKGRGKGGSITTTFIANSEFDTRAISQMTAIQVVVECLDGRTIVGTNMSIAGDLEEDLANGTLKVKFMGASVRVTIP